MGTRMEPQERMALLGRYSYNIIPSAETLSRIRRTQDSINVTGPVKALISRVVGQFTDPEEWQYLFTQLKTRDTSYYGRDYPELEPKLMEKDSPLINTIIKAYDAVFPDAGHYYKDRNMEDREFELWRLLSGKEYVPPTFSGSPTLVELALAHDASMDLKILLRQKFKYSESPHSVVKVSQEERTQLQALLPAVDPTSVLFEFLKALSPREEDGAQALTYGWRNGALEIYTERSLYAEGLHDWFDPTWVQEHGQQMAQEKAGHQERLLLSLLIFLQQQGFDARFLSNSGGAHAIISYQPLTQEYGLFGTGHFSEYEESIPYYNGVLRVAGSTDALIKMVVHLDELVAADQDLSILLSNRSLKGDLETGALTAEAKLKAVEQRLQQLEHLEQQRFNKLRQLNSSDEALEFSNQLEPSEIHGLEEALSGLAGAFGLGRGGIGDENFIGGSTGGFRIRTEDRKRSLNSVEVAIEGEQVNQGRYYSPDYRSQTAPEDGLFPLQAADQVSREGNEYVFESSGRKFINEQGEVGPVEMNTLDRKIWFSYTPGSGNTYLEKSRGSTLYYDHLLMLNKNMRSYGGQEAVLPIDAVKYEITYIQLPINTGQTVEKRPKLLLDAINNQYVVLFTDEGRETNSEYHGTYLPEGTRIYYKERYPRVPAYEAMVGGKLPQTIPNRLLYEVEAPNYLVQLTQKLLDVQKLEPDVVEFLDKVADAQLSIAQKVRACYVFYDKRRVYDPDTPVRSLEDLINKGHGVCKEAAVALLALLRQSGVECRLRIAYPDNTSSGLLIPPLHVVVEYLDDQGMWARIDPPNGTLGPEFAMKVLKDMTNTRAPVIRDAASLSRSTTEFDEYLPHELEMYLSTLQENNGVDLPPAFYTLSEELLHGKHATFRDWLEMVLILDEQGHTELAATLKEEVKGLSAKMVEEALHSLEQIAAVETVGQLGLPEVAVRGMVESVRQHYAWRINQLLLGAS